MQAEVGLENFLIDTNLHYLPALLRLANNWQERIEGILSKFSEDAAHFMRTRNYPRKYPLSLFDNKDENQCFLTWSHQNVFLKKVRGVCASFLRK